MNGRFYDAHLTGQETEPHRGETICLRSHSEQPADWRLKPEASVFPQCFTNTVNCDIVF